MPSKELSPSCPIGIENHCSRPQPVEGVIFVSGFASRNPLIRNWLGGLDSIEEQIRNPTKNGKS
jgi:hypothetical protein